ncbi:hypothetical protein JCM15765_26060 [Paradesulfitobacterium aromaticivorans]
MLSLPEELLLLALNEEKGTLSWVASSKLPYVLAGSLMMELILRKRLAFDGRRFREIDQGLLTYSS